MLKTAIKHVMVATLVVFLSFLFISRPVLAVTYDVTAGIGWWEEPEYSMWWGTSFVEASEQCTWLRAQTSGFEVFTLGYQKDWEVSNQVPNTAYAGITGYGMLETDFSDSGAYLHNKALGFWYPSGGPIQDDAYIIPHPYAP